MISTTGDFIPFIQLHEFESLLFADLQKLETQFPEHDKEIRCLARQAETLGNPELANDDKQSALSKRIAVAMEEFGRRKALVGPIVAGKIGMPVIQAKCRHFREWLERLCSAFDA